MNAPNTVTRKAPSRRATFPYAIEIATRFMDNDVYGHVNNAVYYALFDTVINRYLIAHGLDVLASPVIGLAAESGCRFHASFAYPELIEARLRVGHLGTSSVRYEVGLFAANRDETSRDETGRDAISRDEDPCRAEGHFVHVFVDRATRVPTPIPEPLRSALAALLTR